MDIEEEIPSLQLDSSEDNNGVPRPEDAWPEEVEISDGVEEAPRDEGHTNSQSAHVQPQDAMNEDTEAFDEMEDNKKRHLKMSSLLGMLVTNLICVEKFSDFLQLGRFTLRTEGKTVAVGKVTDLPSTSSSSSLA